jgi:hypothetical protein
MRIIRVLAVIALAAGGWAVGIAPAAEAAKPPFTGRVSCAIGGTLTPKPALTPLVKTKATKYKLLATMSGCSGVYSGGKGAITGGTIKAKAVGTTTDCTRIMGFPPLALSTTFKVKFTGAGGKAVGKSTFTLPLNVGHFNGTGVPVIAGGNGASGGPSFTSTPVSLTFLTGQGADWVGSCSGTTTAFSFLPTTTGIFASNITFDGRTVTTLELEQGANGNTWIVVPQDIAGPPPTGVIAWAGYIFPFDCGFAPPTSGTVTHTGVGAYGVDTGSPYPGVFGCNQVSAVYQGDNAYRPTSRLFAL